MTLLHDEFTISSQYLLNIFSVHLKHYSFWPSADVKPMSHDLVYAMPWQHMFANICVYLNLYEVLQISHVYIGEGYAIMPATATATVTTYLPWPLWEA